MFYNPNIAKPGNIVTLSKCGTGSTEQSNMYSGGNSFEGNSYLNDQVFDVMSHDVEESLIYKPSRKEEEGFDDDDSRNTDSVVNDLQFLKLAAPLENWNMTSNGFVRSWCRH